MLSCCRACGLYPLLLSSNNCSVGHEQGLVKARRVGANDWSYQPDRNGRTKRHLIYHFWANSQIRQLLLFLVVQFHFGISDTPKTFSGLLFILLVGNMRRTILVALFCVAVCVSSTFAWYVLRKWPGCMRASSFSLHSVYRRCSSVF